MAELSKTQIDKLGERLKKGDITEADLRLLDEYRLSFSGAYQFVEESLRKKLALAPTGRPAKSTPSITEKLRRESIRLTQMQDIAGCRLVVHNIHLQNEIVHGLKQLFSEITVVDRRIHTSHGYRAVHGIVQHDGKLVEIQIRTELQHAWAELSEKLADTFDPGLKYGSGTPDLVRILSLFSTLDARFEECLLRSKQMSQRHAPPEEVTALRVEVESILAEVARVSDEATEFLRRRRN